MSESGGIEQEAVKKTAMGAGVAAVGATGLGAAAERSLQRAGKDQIFRAGNENVQVSWKEFIPKDGKIVDPQEAVLFLVGAPMRAKASVTWGSPEQLADKFKVRAYAIDARPQGRFHSNSIDLEVEGIRQFVEENGIKKLTVFAHSIGAVKAANLAVALQQYNPDVTINGLAMANPMGFYTQNAKDLLLNRYPAEVRNEPKVANPNSNRVDKNQLKVTWQLVGSIASDIAATGLGYPKLAEEQIQALTKFNPNLAKVKAPVVLFVAKDDQLAEVKNIFPEQEIQKRLSGPLPEDRRTRMAVVGRARKQYLREKVLPQAANIEVIEASKYASHLAFSERMEETNRIVSRIFQRLSRPNTGVNVK